MSSEEMKVTFEGGHQGRLPREGVYPGAVEKKVLLELILALCPQRCVSQASMFVNG